MSEVRTGGCACGALRFEVTGAPIFDGHCHCRECQKTSGGPMTTGEGLPRFDKLPQG
jgi:hypothetical protein